MSFNDDEFKDIMDNPKSLLTKTGHLPLHTQAVEREVKMVTEASLVVCGEHRRSY